MMIYPEENTRAFFREQRIKNIQQAVTETIAIPKEKSIQAPTQLSLNLDYEDPFQVGKKRRKTVSENTVVNTISTRSRSPKPKQKETPMIVSDLFRYHGISRQSDQPELTAILSFGSQIHYAQVGDSLGAYKVGKIMNDSLYILEGPKRHTIYLR